MDKVYSQGVTVVTNPSQEVQDQVNHFESIMESIEQTLNLIGLGETAAKVEKFAKEAREITAKIKYTAKVLKELSEFVIFIDDIADMINEDVKYYRNLRTVELLSPKEHARAVGRLNSYLQSATDMLNNYMDLWMEGMDNFQELDFKQREDKAKEIRKNVLQQKIAVIKARAALKEQAQEKEIINDIVKRANDPSVLYLGYGGGSVEGYINNSLNKKFSMPSVNMSTREQKTTTTDINYGGSIDNETTAEAAKKSYFSGINSMVKLFYAISVVIFMFGIYKVVTKINLGEDPFRSIIIWTTSCIATVLLGYFIQVFFE
jgi:hypothetical protein